MRHLLILPFVLCFAAPALAGQAEAEVSAALVGAADLGPDARANFSPPDSNEFVLGVVLAQERGKLLVLQKQPAGGYSAVAASAAFEHSFGPRHYVEIVQASGERRFSIQVNTHAECGIQVETFRIARAAGTWRVAGYDKSEPDTQTCDVNLTSRKLSANLLTHRVNVVAYRNGKAVKRESHLATVPAPELGAFSFSMFGQEP